MSAYYRHHQDVKLGMEKETDKGGASTEGTKTTWRKNSLLIHDDSQIFALTQ